MKSKKVPTGPLKTITKRTDDIVTKYPDRLKFLTNMGFDERQAQAALEKTDYDVEYAAARASTLNAHYTSPTVIRSIYDAVGQMGFETGNILEPAMGIGNL